MNLCTVESDLILKLVNNIVNLTLQLAVSRNNHRVLIIDKNGKEPLSYICGSIFHSCRSQTHFEQRIGYPAYFLNQQ